MTVFSLSSVELPQIKEDPESPQMKEEPELCIKSEPKKFPLLSVKSEFEEDASSVLHQRSAGRREETTGEDCEAEAN